MLRESSDVPKAGRHERRWFVDDEMELIVWYDGSTAVDSVVGFQLCYDTGVDEHALTWSVDDGWSHETVDPGDTDPVRDKTPVLLADGMVPIDRIRALFDARGAQLEPALRELVHDRLSRCDLVA